MQSQQPAPTVPLRFGIIGTNFISEWFIRGCRACGVAVPAVVLSRDAARARAFADRHGVDGATSDFDEMTAAADAVYIASPNSAHHGQAMRAIAAGRHVLVEKVMATSLTETFEIVDAALAAGVVAMEATRHLHAPQHRLIRDTLPVLGPIRQVRFAKCQYSSRYDRFRAGEILNAFNPSLGNSALADIGVYVLEPALDLFGTPEEATGRSVLLHNSFEGAGSMVLSYPEFVVDLSWSKITSQVTPSYILGEDGALTIDDLAEPSRIELHLRGEEPRVLHDAPVLACDTLHHEIRAFAQQVRDGATDPRWTQVSLASRQLMDHHLAHYASHRTSGACRRQE